jgi:hypothetical protein
MQEITVELNNDHSVGLGDNLCFLSAMANLPPKVNLLVSNQYNTFEKLTHYAKIFRISKSQLEIVEREHSGTFSNTGWPIKMFTDYYKPAFVNVNGSVIKLNNNVDKKCIALVTASELDPTGENRWPWCRNRPIAYWANIFAWLKSMGYEVITLDHPYFDLETKIEILAKHCKAIISYEGGMAHLAHIMNIPCFLVDWQHPSPSTTFSTFHCDLVHMSNSVYILRDDNEMFQWDLEQFDKKISKLTRGQTNNRFLSKEFTFEIVNELYKDNLIIKNKEGLVCMTVDAPMSLSTLNMLTKKYQ